MSFIGIDLGTSFIKGAVLDPETLAIKHIRRVPFPDPAPGLPALHHEFDPNAILHVTRRLLAELLSAADELALDGAEACEGILMCSQMHGLVFTTEQGEPRSAVVNWQDQRVLEPHPSGQGTYLDVLARQITPDELRQLGNELHPGQPIGVLFWLAEQGRLPDVDLVPASLPDFVLGNLCGAIPTIEASNAAAHGALNRETMDWHHGVIGKLGLGGLRWPMLRRQGEVVGMFQAAGRSIPCYTPVGDYQCSLAGALLQSGELSLNISTGSQVSMLKSTLEFGDYQTRPFFDGRFLATITHIPAGRALAALVRLLTELAVGQGVALPEPWSYISQRVSQVGSTQMRANLSFFTSSCGDRGEFTNIREEELTVGHLFRAAFQNMADNYYGSAQRLLPVETEGTPPWRNLVFSGGLVQKNDTLRDLIVERFGVGYRVCPSSEDTLLGLLALGLAFSGRTASVAEAMGRIYAAYDGE
jgi:sugar (pentulose or hexulose) kinase